MLAKFRSASLCLVASVGCFAGAFVACSSNSNPGFDGGGGGNGSSSSGGGFGGSSSSSSGGGFGGSSSSSSGGGFGGSSSSSSGVGGGSSSSSSGVGTGSSSGTVTAGAQCAPTTATSPMITVASNALVFTPANFLPAMPGTVGMGGYGYAFSDGTSVSCLNGNAFCGAGTIAMANPPTYSVYGGGIGVNLNQVMNATTKMTMAATGSGITYALTNLPSTPATVRLIVDNAGVDYCNNITTATGTVPWSGFFAMCYNLPGGDAGAGLAGPPAAASHVQFQVNSAASGPGAFSFCVTQLAFAP